MANFRGGVRDGSNRGGFRPGGGRDFNNRDSGPKVMHSAICSNCGKSCEVPFRPTGDKPVYCRECFIEKGGGSGGPSTDRFQKRDRGDFRPGSQPRMSPQNGGGNDELRNQLESVNAKLERLIFAVQALAPAREVSKPIPAEKVETKKATKKSKKE